MVTEIRGCGRSLCLPEKSMSNREKYREGLADGVPIALGYFAVAFTLGIVARNAGFSAFQAMVCSFTCNTSAGQSAVFTLVGAGAGYLEVAVMTLVANARYLLMSCALSQKFPPDSPLLPRMIVAYDVTDEIFGISVAQPGYLNPFYTYGAMSVAMPGWALGTFLGVMMGNILPLRVVSALSVGLYGMFLAIIIPPARKSRVIAGVVAVSFLLSGAAAYLPLLRGISAGVKTIVLTVVIALTAAVAFPVGEEEKSDAR